MRKAEFHESLIATDQSISEGYGGSKIKFKKN